MPNIEIDENEFKKRDATHALVAKMLAHPDARRKVLEAHKAVDPSIVIPELDAAKPVEDAIGVLAKKVDDFMAAQTKADQERIANENKRQFLSKWGEGQALLRDTYGVTGDGLKAVEALMERSGIVDHEIGFAAFTALNPEPAPVPPAPNFGFGLFDASGDNPDKFLQAMHASRGQDEGALDKRIHEIRTDLHAQAGQQQNALQRGGRR